MAFETTKKVKFEIGVDGADKLVSALRKITGGLTDTQTQVRFLKSSFVGLTGIGSVGAFIGIVNGAIDARAKLYDLGLQTGISVEALGGLSKVAKLSNTNLDEIASASAKLSKALATTDEDSQGAAQAIKALGLNYEQFKQLGADEQLLAVAQAMEGFADGTGKTAAAMLFFGKTGATLLPFMKELAERGIMATKETTASALAAKEYQDNLVGLRIAADEAAGSLGNTLLPALNEMLRAFNASKGFWAGLGAAGSAAGDRAFDFKEVQFGKQLRVLNADMVNLQREAAAAGLSMGEMANVPGITDKAREIRQLRDAFLGLTGGAAGGGRGVVNPSLVRPKITGLGGSAGKAATPRDDFTPLLRQLTEKVALEQAEYDGIGKLTEAQKLQAKVIADIDGGYIKLTLDQKLLVDARLQDLLVLEKLNTAEQEQAKWLEESNKETEKALELQNRHLQQYEDEVASLQREAREYGLSREQLEQLTSARLRDAAALLLQKRGVEDFNPAQAEMNRLLEQQAAALNKSADLRDSLAARQARDRNDPTAGAERAVKDYLDEVKAAGLATERVVGNAMRSLEDGMVDLFTKGKFDARSFIDTLISEFIRLRVVKPLLADIFGGGGGSGGLGSLFSSFLGLFGGGGGFGTGAGFGNLDLGGFLAAGGPAHAGTPYIVGEQGPELFVPRSAGAVVPNHALGGKSVTLAPVTNIHIDSRSDRAQVAQATAQAVQAGNRQLLEMLHARGAI